MRSTLQRDRAEFAKIGNKQRIWEYGNNKKKEGKEKKNWKNKTKGGGRKKEKITEMDDGKND